MSISSEDIVAEYSRAKVIYSEEMRENRTQEPSYSGEVAVLSNGWVYIPEFDELLSPSSVRLIEPYPGGGFTKKQN